MFIAQRVELSIHLALFLLRHLDKEDVLLLEVVELVGEDPRELDGLHEESLGRVLAVFDLLRRQSQVVEEVTDQAVFIG